MRRVVKLNDFLRNGGTILFDTRDRQFGAGSAMTGGGPGSQRLRQLVDGLDVPALAPIPAGACADQGVLPASGLPRPLWRRTMSGARRRRAGSNDGVSSVIIGGGGLGRRPGRWTRPGAVGTPVFRGRAAAGDGVRFGVNLVMYALTGNYKADQVHVPAILERLGNDGA